jgi:hypothetical protein
MKGITGRPQKAAWLQSEYENRPIEQERMARARIEIELTLSLDAMISLEEKRLFNFPPLSDIRVEPRVQGIFGYSSSLGGRTHTYTYLIGDPALLYKSSRSEDLSPIRRLYSAITYASSVTSVRARAHPGAIR